MKKKTLLTALVLGAMTVPSVFAYDDIDGVNYNIKDPNIGTYVERQPDGTTTSKLVLRKELMGVEGIRLVADNDPASSFRDSGYIGGSSVIMKTVDKSTTDTMEYARMESGSVDLVRHENGQDVYTTRVSYGGFTNTNRENKKIDIMHGTINISDYSNDAHDHDITLGLEHGLYQGDMTERNGSRLTKDKLTISKANGEEEYDDYGNDITKKFTADYDLNGMTVANEYGNIKFTTSGINAGNQIINGVDTGVADTDAVNVKQLKDYVAANDKDTHATVTAGNRVSVTTGTNTDGTPNYTVAIDQATSDQINNNSSAINTLNQTINNVNDRYDSLTRTVSNNQKEARRGIAGAAAVAALHPLDFDPDHKLDIMAGVGHFKGQTATALGLAYRPNEDVMFTLGGAINGSDSVLNAGISYKVGAKSNVSRSRVAVAKDLQDLKATVAKLQADNEKLKAIVNAVTGANMTVEQDKLFPDVPSNHWAYEAVEGLRQRGLVIGYEDGNFKGDRLLTRYEFAQIVYRALQRAQEAGQEIDARLVEEFSPEMVRFKVEQMGKGIERVHVQTSTKDVQRDAYGTILK